MNIFENCFRTKNEEFAWKEEDVLEVVDELQKRQLAVIGGEVWIVDNNNNFEELYWYDFGVEDKANDDSWGTFVRKSAEEYLRNFNELRGTTRINEEKEIKDGEIYFHISFLDEEKYYNLLDSLNLNEE